MKAIYAAVLAAGLFAACGGGGSEARPPAEQPDNELSWGAPAAAASVPPARDVHTCPVDKEICDFALEFEASLQRGDAWTAEGRYVHEEPPTGLPTVERGVA